MPLDDRVSALDFNERTELHDDLRGIARAAELAMGHIDESTAIVGELLAMYDLRWDHDVAFAGAVVHYAQQVLPKGALETLHTDLGDRPRERLDVQPPYLSVTIPEWHGAERPRRWAGVAVTPDTTPHVRQALAWGGGAS